MKVLKVCGEAENGAEALDKYKELHPDLVTLDITMPKRDGLEALKDIRAHDAKARVIMCSAMGQQTMVIEAIQNGAKDFIVKPFQVDNMPFSFEADAIGKNAAETEVLLLPILKEAKEKWTELSDILFILRTNIRSVNDILKLQCYEQYKKWYETISY